MRRPGANAVPLLDVEFPQVAPSELDQLLAPAGQDGPGPVAGEALRGVTAARDDLPKTTADPGRRVTRAGRPSSSTTSPTRNCRPRRVSGSPFTRTSPAEISSLASEPASTRSASFRNCPSRMESSRMGTSTGLRTGMYRSSHGRRPGCPGRPAAASQSGTSTSTTSAPAGSTRSPARAHPALLRDARRGQALAQHLVLFPRGQRVDDTIFEGTSEIQRMIIGRAVTRLDVR